jgi:hypothetical protein
LGSGIDADREWNVVKSKLKVAGILVSAAAILTFAGATSLAAGAASSVSATQSVLPSNAATDTSTGAFHPDNFIGDWNSQNSSCPVTGYCVSAGQFVDNTGHIQGLVETQTSGTWTASAAKLPTNAATDAGTNGVYPHNVLWGTGCSSKLNCAVVGQYIDQSGYSQPLINTETNGAWSDATAPLPKGAASDSQLATLSSTLTFTPTNSLNSVACPSDNNCVAVGQYVDSNGFTQAFLDLEVNGTWSALSAPLPSNAVTDTTASANNSPGNLFYAVACSSTQNCVAVGDYADNYANAGLQALIDVETNGAWSAVTAPLPADAATNTNGSYGENPLYAVACPANGDCVVGGEYSNKYSTSSPFQFEPLLDTETNGTWSSVSVPLPPDASTDTTQASQTGLINTVTCTSAGNCVAGGSYANQTTNGSTTQIEALLAVQSGGAWKNVPVPLPSDALVNAPSSVSSPNDALFSAACTSAGNCVASGIYTSSAGTQQALLLTQQSGVWSNTPVVLPSGASTHTSPSSASWTSLTNMLNTTACAGSDCFVGGFFLDSADWQQPLQVDVSLGGSSTVPPKKTAPTAPTISLGSQSKTSVVVKIKAPSSAGSSPLQGYQYSLNTGKTWLNCPKGTKSSFTVTKLLAKHTYKIEVRAYSAVGPGAASKPIVAKTI